MAPLGHTDREPKRGLDWTTVLGWVVAVLLAYGAVEARVRVLEDRYERIREDLGEIKSDLKALRGWKP